jgi:hypothetical protein
MSCVEREKLFAYSRHLLEPSEEGEVGAHVSGCSHCRGIAEQYQKLEAVLEEWKPVEPSPWFDVRLRAAVERAEAPSAGWLGLLGIRRLVPALAAVLVVVGLVVVLRQSRHASAPALSQVGQKATAAAASAQAPAQPEASEAEAGQEELSLYRNLPILEDYDLLTDFEVLSELPKSEKQVDN